MSYQNDRIKGIPASLPKDYDRQANFTNWEVQNPGEPPRGTDLDAEFNVVEQAVDETQARLRLIQRDDGALLNESVGLDQLKNEARIGVNAATSWDEFTSYAVNDSVIDPNGAWYVALESHVSSSSFQDDLTAGKWRQLINLVPYTTEAKNWATLGEDVPVPEGDGTEYSAEHHAAKALASEIAAQLAQQNAEDAETEAKSARNTAVSAAGNAQDAEVGAEDARDEARDFVTSTEYEFVGDYTAGLTLTAYNQIVRDTSGEFWRVSGSQSLPYTLTGAGLPEGGALVSVGDAALRQDLVQPVATFDSVSAMKASTVLGVGRKARTLGYYAPGDGGGNDYEIVAGATGTADGGSFTDLDNGLQAKGLFPTGTVYVAQFGGTTAGEVQKAIIYVQDSSSGDRLDAQYVPLVLEGGFVHGRNNSGINSLTVTAGATFSDISNNNAILRTKTGLRQNYRDFKFDCSGLSNGVWNESGGFFNHYEHVEIDNYRDFGMQFDGSGDQHLVNSLITGQAEVSERSGTGVFINTGDFKLVNTTIRYASIPLEVSKNTLLATGNHIYNGSAGSEDPATDSTGILISGGSGISFSHTYLDKGTVVCDDTFSVSFFDTKLLFNSTPEHQAVFNFVNSETSRDWPDEFSFDGARSTIPLNNGSMQFVRLSGSGWTTEAESIKNEINLRHNGYPRIVPQETAYVVAPNRTEISKGGRTTKYHTFGANTYSANTNAGVREAYENRYAGFESGGIVLAAKGDGEFTDGHLRAEGSRSGEALVAQVQLRDRKGSSTWDDTNGFEIDLRMRGSSNNQLNKLQVVAKEAGQTGESVWTEWNRNSFRPANNDTLSCGAAGYKWSEVFATNGTINTSDEREKNFAEIEDAEHKVAHEAKKLLRKYKWNSAIEEKGEKGARWHFGVGAQSLKALFEEYGLNAHEYGLFCYDEWEAEYEEVEVSPEVLDDEENIIEPAKTERRKIKEAGNQYGVRYEELLAFIVSAL